VIGHALPIDGRSVGELLLDADLTARASLWDPNPAGAKARVRSWGEVAEAAAELWASIPDETADPSMRRVEQLARGLHRTHLRAGWPGTGPGDPDLEAIATSLARAAELVQARRHPTAPLSHGGQLDADGARTRLMHAVYVASHSVGVALYNHLADLQRRLDARQVIPAGDSLQHARDTMRRLDAVERLAGTYLHSRWPSALAGMHRDQPEQARLAGALARWDMQAHRTLAAPPTSANLEWIARIQQELVITAAVIGAAAAHQGQLDPSDVQRARPALANLEDAWAGLATELAKLHGRHRAIDPALLLAGREVQAAMREITHEHAGYASPAAMATRADLALTVGNLRDSLTAVVALAHVTRDALGDPYLTVSARAAHRLATHVAAPATNAHWVDAGSLHRNRDIPPPHPLRSSLGERAEQIITAAVTADSAALGLYRPRTPDPQGTRSFGRAREDRTPPTSTPTAGWGCER
jgi:hypothetical protein